MRGYLASHGMINLPNSNYNAEELLRYRLEKPVEEQNFQSDQYFGSCCWNFGIPCHHAVCIF